MSLLKLINATKYQHACRAISNTAPLLLNQKIRQQKGLPLNPNTQANLRDGPDYTFLDGRLTPCGTRQKSRILKQREIAEQIISLTKEVDFAVERHNNLQIEEANRRKAIIDSKLKPKGLNLLKSK